MVDAADRRRISRPSMDRLPPVYVHTTHMASIALGKWYQLEYRSDCVVLDCSDLQAMPMAAGIGGYLADFMGAANAKADCVMFRTVWLFLVNRALQPIPVKMPVAIMLYRGLLPMGSIDDPSFSCQIREGRMPICPLPVTIMGIASHQMPASSVKIEPSILAHQKFSPLFRQMRFHFKDNSYI